MSLTQTRNVQCTTHTHTDRHTNKVDINSNDKHYTVPGTVLSVDIY